MKNLKSLLVTAAAVALPLAPLSANAALTISFDDLADGAGTNVFSVTDQGVGDTSALLGVLLTSVSPFAGWSVIVGNASSASINGAQAGPHLDAFAISGLGNVRISLTETGLSLGAAGSQILSAQFGGALATGGAISWALYADDNDQAFATSALVTSGVGFGSGSGLVSPLTDPYSMTLVVDLKHTQLGTSSFNYGTTVPEPTSLALISLALLGAGAATRRRKA